MTALRTALLVLLLAPVTGSTAAAQIRLGTWVFAAGGGAMSGDAYTAAGTTGQSVIGRSTSATYVASAGFWGDGGTILEVEDPVPSGLPMEFVLGQNYPNPFNPATSIPYELPVASDVTLSVCDILGREVSVVVKARNEAGAHTVTFDASALSSGIYLYVLRAGDFVAVKKLVVVK